MLYSRESQRKFEDSLNGIIILDNAHRFKDDPWYGGLMKRFWKNDLTTDERNTLNSQEVDGEKVVLPDVLSSTKDWSYACPYNKERNAISSGIFKRHVEMTHPKITDEELPPDHTIIIEGHFELGSPGKRGSRKIRKVIRHRIVTSCGDNDIEYGSRKKADPALCLYRSIDLICVTSNKDMEENPPRGNGTVVTFVSVKIRRNATTYRWKEYNGRKVWTVNAKDVEWITVELKDNANEINKILADIEEMKANNNIDPHAKRINIEKLENNLLQLRKKDNSKSNPRNTQSQ